MLTAERLREVLRYDPDTGVFTWRATAGRKNLVAGTIRKQDGHRKIGLLRGQYLAHRLAWLYMTGEWPAGEVDHRDCNPDNNAWINLRLADKHQNGCNRGPKRNNSTGLKGVVFHKKIGRYAGRIQVKGKQYHLGCFATAEEAHAAYCDAAVKYHGEFARARC